MTRTKISVCSVPGCPNVTFESKCATHAREAQKAQDAKRGTRTQRGLGNDWLRLRDAAVREHVHVAGWICPGWKRLPHAVAPGRLTGDHIVPRSVAPERALDPSNIAVLCFSCNSAKGASTDSAPTTPRPTAEPRVYRSGSVGTG